MPFSKTPPVTTVAVMARCQGGASTASRRTVTFGGYSSGEKTATVSPRIRVQRSPNNRYYEDCTHPSCNSHGTTSSTASVSRGRRKLPGEQLRRRLLRLAATMEGARSSRRKPSVPPVEEAVNTENTTKRGT